MLDDVGENGRVAVGEKQRARDILAALRTLKEVERRGDQATPEERATLERFGGFGPVALHLFPDPVTGRFRDSWDNLGRELADLLTPDEYASARRTTFNAFYTSPAVMRAIWDGMARLGLPEQSRVLEPGCGIGNFLAHAPAGTRLLGVEMDGISGRIARALHPDAEIRIENFRDTVLPVGAIDGAVGNVPFADLTYEHGGQRLSLHDYFFAKTVDALAPGGVLGLVTSRYTMDKLNAAAREYLADRADFVGAIRLPDEAFRQQGTRVVTDIIFLRRRGEGETPAHAGDWLELSTLGLPDGREATVNQWFAERPEMILGEVALDHGMYGNDTLRVRGGDDYPARLAAAIATLPEGVCTVRSRIWDAPEEAVSEIPPGLGEGAFFVAPDKTLLQVEAGRAEPVTHGATVLKSDGGLMGRRLADLIGLRDAARRVLKTQNEGQPDEVREAARRELNRLYSRFVSAYGPINKTTRSQTADGTEIRRMPNLARFREDPDAFLVASLEEYDDATGRAERAPIMRQDVVGPSRPVMRVETAEDGLLVSLNERGRVDLPLISRLSGRDEDAVIAELGSLIFYDPAADEWVTRDAYLSGNVRRKLIEAGVPAAEIADIGEAGTDAKKEALFERMRAGLLRVLLGSTAKMGTGTNVQKRLVAVHHLDAPWKPAEIEQRDGRILRQGNRNKEVEIARYVTEASFDAYMWQTLENKARFIAQVMKGDAGVRRAGDIGGQELSFAEVKAIASGNPAVLTLAEIEAELQRLALLARSHADDQYRARLQVKSLPEDIERLEARAAGLEADHGAATPAPRGERRDDLVEALNKRLKAIVARAGAETTVTPLSSYRGLALAVVTRKGSVPELQLSGVLTHFLDFKAVAAGSLLNRVDHLIDEMPSRAAEAQDRARMKRGQLASFRDRIGLVFDGASRLERLGELRNVIEGALSAREEQEGQAEALSAAVAEFEAMKGEASPSPASMPAPAPGILDTPEDLAEEEPSPAEAKPKPTAAPRPATVLDMTRTRPVHQGNLFEVTPPAPAPEPARSFRQMVASGRKAQQLKLF
jgi:SAM-dependent methyltransferase